MPELLRGIRARFCSISPGQQVGDSSIQRSDFFIRDSKFDYSHASRMRPDTEADRAARAAAASAVRKPAQLRLGTPLRGSPIIGTSLPF